MICLSIGAKGVKKVTEELSLARRAEIRLDLTNLSRLETVTVFRSRKSLIATCKTMGGLSYKECEKRLFWAILGSRTRKLRGERYLDIDYGFPPEFREKLISVAKKVGFKIIISYHNMEATDSAERLREIYLSAMGWGSDIVKIVTKTHNIQESSRLINLYKDFPPHTLLAFAIGQQGRFTRLLSVTLGAPFIFCTSKPGKETADGQYTIAEAEKLLSKRGYPTLASRKSLLPIITAPASKSHAQRIILSAAWAKGKSNLYGYTPCADSEAAISLVRSFGVKVKKERSKLPKFVLKIESPGFDELIKNLHKQKIFLKKNKSIRINVGESGLLCRFMIPAAGYILKRSEEIEVVTIAGKGSLKERTLLSTESALNAIGLNVETNDGRLPATVKGILKGATFKTSGKDGSQLLSGMLMTLPLCEKSSHIKLTESTSVPYIGMTIKTLKEFDISINNNDFEEFKISGKQKYKGKPYLPIEGDWSGASMLMVAGAITKGITITNLPIDSKQADEKIIEILQSCGVEINITEYPKYFVMCGDVPFVFTEDGPDEIIMGSKIEVLKPKAPLMPFEADATNYPDLFPSLVVLALNCNGVSRIKGVERLSNKESNRAESLYSEFTKLGADIAIDNDWMIIKGGKELHGALCSSHNDHRIIMALITASLKIKEKIFVDDLECISKSFPDFIKTFK